MDDYNFNINSTELVAVLRDMGEKVIWPNEIRTNPSKISHAHWCEFHGDHVHKTTECKALQGEVDRLLKIGYLIELFSEKANKSYMKTGMMKSHPGLRLQMVVNVIFGGEEVNGVTYTTSKKLSKIFITH